MEKLHRVAQLLSRHRSDHQCTEGQTEQQVQLDDGDEQHQHGDAGEGGDNEPGIAGVSGLGQQPAGGACNC
ncbi:MAG: hypothetical protein ACR2LE_01170 [Nocardioidaceae bacterium]